MEFKFNMLLKYCFLVYLVSDFYASNAQIKVGAEQTEKYITLLKGKKVALIVNQTSMVGKKHLVDTLLKLGINVKVIFAPEHGFRGDHSNGAKVSSAIDSITKIKITSLYGNNKKPTQEQLKGIDQVVFDIQDVGVRFYTYISTMHYAMEACAENKIPFLVLDRPNPNGYYIDGPILDLKFQSFVGMHPIPLVHGMTVGELAQMINGEKWLKDSVKCKLVVISVIKYIHNYQYKLPVNPSPNLPTQNSIYLYPTLGLFEGTPISVGRGTSKPFELLGRPGLLKGNTEFTPISIAGISENPPYLNQKCKGFDVSNFCENFIISSQQIYLQWLILTYQLDTNKQKFFTPFFDKLAGTDKLRKEIVAGKTEAEIRAGWQDGIENFKKRREKYLLYEYNKEMGLIIK